MHIHFIGICGTAMGNVALMMRAAGHTVTGSDENIYPPMSDLLAEAGVAIIAGFAPENLRPAPDLTVIGNKISRGNPEAEEALDRRLRYTSLPELLMAYRLQERAAGVGFDWPDSSGPAAKVREDLAEVEAETSPERLDHEIGDLLFSVVNLARKVGVHPGPALDRANPRFADRFRIVEHLAAERGIEMHRATLDQLDALWDEAKTGLIE